MRSIKLESNDGEMFTVDLEIARKFGIINTMLEDLGEEEQEDEETVPLPNVTSTILQKVIQWVTHHKDDPALPEDDQKERNDPIPSWDSEFLNVDQVTLVNLILAANYLDIKKLLDVTCKTVANIIKGKTPEEIREVFNIEKDLSPSEEAQIRKENEWIENSINQ